MQLAFYKISLPLFLLFFAFVYLDQNLHSFETRFDFTYLHYETKHFWNKAGHKKDSCNHFKKNEAQLYMEFLPTSTTVISALGNFSAITDRLNGDSYGFGDIQVNWTFKPLPCRADNLWINLTTCVPTGEERHALRYGQWAIEGDLFYSDVGSVRGHSLWYYFGAGYRGYLGYPSNQILAIANGTLALNSNLYLYGIGNIEWGLFNGKRKEHYNQFLFNPNYRLIKIQIGILGYLTDGLYVDLGYFYPIWGANIGTGGGFSGGIILRF